MIQQWHVSQSLVYMYFATFLSVVLGLAQTDTSGPIFHRKTSRIPSPS